MLVFQNGLRYVNILELNTRSHVLDLLIIMIITEKNQ